MMDFWGVGSVGRRFFVMGFSAVYCSGVVLVFRDCRDGELGGIVRGGYLVWGWIFGFELRWGLVWVLK